MHACVTNPPCRFVRWCAYDLIRCVCMLERLAMLLTSSLRNSLSPICARARCAHWTPMCHAVRCVPYTCTLNAIVCYTTHSTDTYLCCGRTLAYHRDDRSLPGREQGVHARENATLHAAKRATRLLSSGGNSGGNGDGGGGGVGVATILRAEAALRSSVRVEQQLRPVSA